MPFLSVIIPFFGDIDQAEACLVSIQASHYRDCEVILADDGAADALAVPEIASRHGARFVRLDSNSGPAAARNAAARVATGEILVFFDADTTVHRDTLTRIAAAFSGDPSLDALMGSYDLTPPAAGHVAAFRNLLHAHVHHRSAGNVSTFWAGCGAVRRKKFELLKGFDESFVKPSIEDVEFGSRLHEAGCKLRLDPSVQVTHHKEWTLASMMYADVFLRARPWTELMMRHGLPKNLNFRWQDRSSVVLSVLLCLLAALGMVQRSVWWIPFLFALVAVAFLQWPVLRFFARQRGLFFSIASFPLLLLHNLLAAAGFGFGLLRWETTRDPWFLRAAALFAILIFGAIQIAGGAYTAEFDGQRDESAHFMSGLMVRDFLVQLPLSQPLSWAEQYYIHYPRVRLGHWPPLYHLLEAGWWLLFPPSRFSALLLVGLLGVAAAVAFYRVARRIAGPPAAIFLTCLLLAAPLFQQSSTQVMTEMLSLVCGLCFLDALVRLLSGGGRAAALQVGLWAGLALMVNGIAACLVPAPFVALVLARQGKLLRLRSLAIPALVALAVGALWFPITMPSLSLLAGWAGIGKSIPWNIQYLTTLAGPGVAVLAAAGILSLLWKPEPVAAASAGVLVSVAAVSFVLRAMLDLRHWVLALPCLLLLGAVCVRQAMGTPPRPARMVAAAALVVLALGLFPWERYTQAPSGFRALAAQVKQPARMLVSGSSFAEGSWIVIASLREPRPSSLIVRSTKVFDGDPTGLKSGIEGALDRMGLDTVILDDRPGFSSLSPADRLLRESLVSSAAWRRCAQSGGLSAYCRAQLSRVPIQPLKLDLSVYLGRSIMEEPPRGFRSSDTARDR